MNRHNLSYITRSAIVANFYSRSFVLAVALIVVFQVSCSTSPLIDEYDTTLGCPDCQSQRVLRIIDGDTLDTPSGRVRLFGIDTPEKGEACYTQATKTLRRLASNTIRVEPGPRHRDRGGRLLYYAYTDSGNSIDEILVREGLAVAWTRDGQHRDLLGDLELEARRDRTGCLW